MSRGLSSGSRRRWLALVMVVALSAVVSAHLKAVRTLPADGAKLRQSPSDLRVWFSEAPALGFSSLSLVGPRGAVKVSAVALGAEQSVTAKVADALPPGGYEASWKTAGDDGHVVRGTFRFTIVTPAP